MLRKLTHIFERDRGLAPHMETLFAAIEQGDYDYVRDAISAAQDITKHCSSAVIQAAAWGQTEILELLLEAGADPNAGDCDALIWAVGGGHEKTVRVLVEYGADVHKYSPIMNAIECGHPEIVKVLAEKGARIPSLPESGLRWLESQGFDDTADVVRSLKFRKHNNSANGPVL